MGSPCKLYARAGIFHLVGERAADDADLYMQEAVFRLARGADGVFEGVG